MATTLKPDERLVRIGQTALRAPGGEHLPAVPMYIIVPAALVDKKTKLSEGEKEPCEDAAGLLAENFKAYMDGVKALERGVVA